MTRSALACLPAAAVATFVGVIACPAESHAGAPGACSRSDEISLQRQDARQFELAVGSAPDTARACAEHGPAHAGPPSGPSLQAIAFECGCTTPDSAADMEPTSRNEDPVILATGILETGFKIMTLIMFIRIAHRMGDSHHSETPSSLGAAR